MFFAYYIEKDENILKMQPFEPEVKYLDFDRYWKDRKNLHGSLEYRSNLEDEDFRTSADLDEEFVEM